MEVFKIDKDIPIFYFNVPDFPQGIEEKFTEIMKMLPSMEGRTFYGISFMNDEGKIIYNCGVRQMKETEPVEYGGTPFTLTKGEYLSERIHEWMNKIDTIAPTLAHLMDDTRADKGFPCIEVYNTNRELQCLVRVAEKK